MSRACADCFGVRNRSFVLVAYESLAVRADHNRTDMHRGAGDDRIRSDRNLAAASQLREYGALGCDTAVRFSMIQFQARLHGFAAGTRLNGKRTLPHRRAHDLDRKVLGDTMRPAQPV